MARRQPTAEPITEPIAAPAAPGTNDASTAIRKARTRVDGRAGTESDGDIDADTARSGDDDADLVASVRTLLAPDGWEFHTRADRCRVLPPHHVDRAQGWQLHLSATAGSAPTVLARVLPVLRSYAVAFTFAASTAAVRRLTGRDCESAAFGKILTIYPNDDAQAPTLAAELHARTKGLAGPRLLSGRPYRRDSLVHYRFGGFHDAFRLDDDGVRRFVVSAPGGGTVEDRRESGGAAPDWAPSPFDAGATTTETGTGAQPRTGAPLGGRFVVRRTLRRSPRGGVQLAYDQETGAEVILKHARMHVDADLGRDARDRLRHEAAMLGLLAGEAAVPRVLAVFSYDDDLFLAEELLPGQGLRPWVRASAGGAEPIRTEHVLLLARRLVALVAGVHAAGVVLRDLDPSAVLVAPNGALSLVSLEAAATGGQQAPPCAGTSGYRAPERRDQRHHVAARFSEDLWSLGALLFLLVTGSDPVLPDDEPADDRPIRDRLAAWLAAVAVDNEAARLLAAPILGLLATVPDLRWSLARVEKYLAVHTDLSDTGAQGRGGRASAGRRGTGAETERGGASGRGGAERRAGSRPGGNTGAAGVPVPSAERLLADGLDHLLATMSPVRRDSDADRLWPTSAFGARTDPGNVQHGAAGVLGVLLEALDHAAPPDREPLRAAIRRTATWLAGYRPAREPGHALPGLYFGRAGTAWALAEAGGVLEDADLVARAVDMLWSLPTTWPNADVAHGLAGAGLAHLRVAWQTGDPRLLDRAQEYANAVAAAAVDGDHGPLWPVPSDARSRLAGACHYGFAHGVAGIGYFLLAAGMATDQESYVKIALDAGHTLCRSATTDSNGAAWWPIGPKDRTRMPHWCSGSSGIGTFLLRLYAATDEPAIGAYAGAAAVAVHRSRWHSSPSACHGLAGDGQYLVDVAQVLGTDIYRTWARDLVEAMAVRHCRRAGKLLVPDETGRAVVADYQTGLAGVVSFLLRLRHDGPRPWMVDEWLEQAPADPDS